MLGAVPLPPGGRVVDRAPAPELRTAQFDMAPVDPKLSRHSWWTIPLGGGAFVRWVRSHLPHSLHVDSTGGSSAPGQATIETLTLAGRGTAAYGQPGVDFSYVPYDGGVAVRLDTMIAARFGRTVLVPAGTTRVRIRRTTRTSSARRPVTRTAVITRPGAVDRLVARADRLLGSVTVPVLVNCTLITVIPTYVVTFIGPHGRYALTGEDVACPPQLTVRQDGARVRPILDPGTHWFGALRRALARR